MIPIPPIQWVRLLHKSTDFGRDSISVRMDAPVVEKPETDSKNALTKEGMAPEKMKGKHPTRPIISHESVTVRKASFLLIFSLL